MATYYGTDTTSSWSEWVMVPVSLGTSTVSSDTSTSTSSTATTWTQWTGSSTAMVTQGTWVIWTTDDSPGWQSISDEQYRAERERLAQAAAEAQQKREAARQRARATLQAMLDAEQRDQLEKHRFFEVVAKATGTRYRVYQGFSRNVLQLKEGKPVVRLCAHPRDDVPDEDTMLAQKLMLEHDEAAFLQVANRSAA